MTTSTGRAGAVGRWSTPRRPSHAGLVDEAAARCSHEKRTDDVGFPSAGTLESQTISMAASVVAPESRADGVFTRVGTEWIMVAARGYRDSTPATRGTLFAPVT